MRTTQKQGRARGRGQRKPGNGNVLNRVYESSGPEGKVRGTPQQIVDKYLALARDAQTAGDRVTAENFLQHAEHYQRILTQAAQQQAERRDQSQQDGDGDGDGQHESQHESHQSQANGSGGNRVVEALQTIETEGDGGDLLVDEPRPAQSRAAAEEPKKPRGRKPKAAGTAGDGAEAPQPDGQQASEGGDQPAEEAAEARPARTRRSRSRETPAETGAAEPTPSEANAGNG